MKSNHDARSISFKPGPSLEQTGPDTYRIVATKPQQETIFGAFSKLPPLIREQPTILWAWHDGNRKPPINPYTGRLATGDNAALSVSMPFPQACKLREQGKGDGLAIIPETIIGGDIDGCILEDGTYTQAAKDAINMMPAATFEISPSGRGLRFFGQGEFPEGYKHQTGAPANVAKSIEVYGPHTPGRHVTVTGNIVHDGGCGDIQDGLNQFVAKYMPKLTARDKKQQAAEVVTQSTGLTDQAVLRVAFASKFGREIEELYSGAAVSNSNPGDGTPSIGDFHLGRHLGFYTGCDMEQGLRIVMNSPRQEIRKKPEKYWRHTLYKAYKACGNVYRMRAEVQSIEQAEQRIKQALKSKDADSIAAAIEAAARYIGGNYAPVTFPAHFTKLDEASGKRNNLYRYADLFACVAHSAYEQATRPIIDHLDPHKWNAEVSELGQNDLVQNKYLPPISLNQGDTVLYQSPLGTGKTEILAAEVAKMKAESITTKILYIVPRISLARSACQRIPELALYEDVKRQGGHERHENARSMVAVVNSLPKLINDDYKFDLVILDEIELLQSHLIGGTIKNKDTVVNCLYQILNGADKVVCLDALMGKTTIDTLTRAGRKNFKVNYNPAQPWKDTSVKWYSDMDNMLSLALEDVRAKKPVFIFTNSRAKADVIERMLKNAGGDDVLKISRETSSDSDAVNFIKKPDTESEKYFIIICTPSVEAGVSIGTDRFNKVYAVFEPVEDGGNVLSAVQQLGRCRKATEWNIFVPDKRFDLPTNPTSCLIPKAAIYAHAQQRSESGLKVELDFDNDVADLYGRVTAWDNTQKNRFSQALYAILTEKLGCSVQYVPGENETVLQLRLDAKEAMINEHATAVINASKTGPDGLPDDADRYQVERHIIESEYIIDFDTMEDEQDAIEAVKIHDGGRGLKPVKALETTIGVTTEEVKQYALCRLFGGTLQADDAEIKIDALHGIENQHSLLLQHELRSIVLSIAGVNLETGEILPGSEWSQSTLKNSKFHTYLFSNFDAINGAKLGFSLSGNWEGNLCKPFNIMLKNLGFSLNSHQKTARGGGNDTHQTTPPLYRGRKIGVCHAEKMKGERTYFLDIDAVNVSLETVKRRIESGKNWVKGFVEKIRPTFPQSELIRTLEAMALAELLQWIDDNWQTFCELSDSDKAEVAVIKEEKRDQFLTENPYSAVPIAVGW